LLVLISRRIPVVYKGRRRLRYWQPLVVRICWGRRMMGEWSGGCRTKPVRKMATKVRKSEKLTTLIHIGRSWIGSIWVIVCMVRHLQGNQAKWSQKTEREAFNGSKRGFKLLKALVGCR
jgi:hypothetical protein